MTDKELIKLSAEFEMAFRYLESNRIKILDKLTYVDVFANYFYPHSDEDYIEGEINEYSPAFMFIEKMIDNFSDCRNIIYKELIDREEYILLSKVKEPLSKTTELLITGLNIF